MGVVRTDPILCAITEIAGRLLRLLFNSLPSLDGPLHPTAQTAENFNSETPARLGGQAKAANSALERRADRKLLSTRQIDVNVKLQPMAELQPGQPFCYGVRCGGRALFPPAPVLL